MASKQSKWSGPSGVVSRLSGIMIASLGAVLAALGLTVGCLCGVSPVPFLLGASGILAGLFVFGNWPLVLIGAVFLSLGSYIFYTRWKRK